MAECRMGFFTEIGSGLGKIAGGLIGGTVAVVGDIVGSETIKQINKGALERLKRDYDFEKNTKNF